MIINHFHQRMTMQNASYIVRRFSENLSKITTIKQLIDLSKVQEFEIEIELVHRIPRVLVWHPAEDSFSEEYNLFVRPRILIGGKILAPHKMFASQFPLGIVDCERVFLESVKQAINDVEQVLN